MNCQERSGFLFSHDCDLPAIATCMTCGKSICAVHQRIPGARIVCVSCFRLLPEARLATDDPYFYASSHSDGWSSWDAGDYAAFDSRSGEGGRSGGAGATGNFESDVDGT